MSASKRVSKELSVGQVADRVMAINDGKLLAIGTPDEVRSNADVQRAYLGAGQ